MDTQHRTFLSSHAQLRTASGNGDIIQKSRGSGYTVYIVKTSSDTLYIGQTKNLQKRLVEHAQKTTRSAKYLRYFASFVLVYTEVCRTRSTALKREKALKRLTRAQKDRIIHGWNSGKGNRME